MDNKHYCIHLLAQSLQGASIDAIVDYIELEIERLPYDPKTIIDFIQKQANQGKLYCEQGQILWRANSHVY